ncbi:hypothetical protein DFA_11757 [Cavenderia fasciculata]|uniref:Uncharacterized protein n=1 Tax=Cavenderia fasciculata TaxID=261658 RepID=F4QE49_CACFS|nr:uncharacterized protein DFA_11757 [Cavenderia fasciculata]EGG13996.1 hypothetical protein DFA_11757 [Cavenderia fasciculata]|eukprot:XP_004350704.1 hypothetical protein DFA_11757 [Cavenderia fasciculata]
MTFQYVLRNGIIVLFIIPLVELSYGQIGIPLPPDEREYSNLPIFLLQTKTITVASAIWLIKQYKLPIPQDQTLCSYKDPQDFQPFFSPNGYISGIFLLLTRC